MRRLPRTLAAIAAVATKAETHGNATPMSPLAPDGTAVRVTRRLHSITALVLALVAGWPSVARAETGVADTTSPCPTVEPMVPARVPANTNAIAVKGTASAMSLVTSDDRTYDISLGPLGSDGYAIATWALRLIPGSEYRVRWTDACSIVHERLFVTIDEQPLPTDPGFAVVVPRYTGMPCDDEGRPAGMVTGAVYLSPSKELSPFLGLAATDLIVEPAPTLGSGMHPGYAVSGAAGEFAQKCPDGPRDFTVSVRVRIPNGPTLTTAPIAASLPCPTTCTPRAPGDWDANAAGTGESDAGAGASPEGADQGGIQCTTSSASSAPTTLVLLTLALTTLGHLARRRR